MNKLKIINVLHIGDKVLNMAEMSPDERQEVAARLNEQALKNLGYRKVEKILTA